MSKLLPDNIFLSGAWSPWPAESNCQDLMVIGKIPKELNGVYYRNGPNPQYVFSDKYHYFEGDGMIHALSFKNGHVHYSNRWVRTEKFKLERSLQKSVICGFRDSIFLEQLAQAYDRNTANTHIVWHAKRLLALNEGALPVEMDPQSLNTIGKFDFGGMLEQSMTAHPKIDPVTKNLHFYSYSFQGSDNKICYYIANEQGKVICKKFIPIPFSCLLHDFVITKEFAIFPFYPLTTSVDRLLKGEPYFSWEPKRGSYFLVVPHEASKNNNYTFHTEACFSMHTVNAYQKGSDIILDTMMVDKISDDALAFDDDTQNYASQITRLILELKTGKIHKERLNEVNGEFPRIDERLIGRPYRYAFIASTSDSSYNQSMFDSLTAFDLIKNNNQTVYLGENSVCGEPIFVAKSNPKSEGEGYLLSYVYRKNENRSDLLIFNAHFLGNGPIAVVKIPHRVPYGFHGSWVPED